MKRVALVGLALVVLSGCSSKTPPGASGGASSTSTAPTSPSAKPTPSPTGYHVGDTLTTAAGNTVQLFAITPTATGTNPLAALPSGDTLAAADLQVCAGASPAGGQQEYTADLFTLQMADNTQARPDVLGKAPELTGGSLPPNQCARGWVSFDVPAGETPVEVLVSSGTGTLIFHLSS